MSFKTWVGRTQKEALEHAIKAVHIVNSTFVPLSYYGFLYAVSSSCGAKSCKYHIYTNGNGTPRLQKLGGLFSPLIMGKIAREYNAPFRVRPYGHYGPYDKTTVLHRWSSLLKTVQKMFISKRVSNDTTHISIVWRWPRSKVNSGESIMSAIHSEMATRTCELYSVHSVQTLVSYLDRGYSFVDYNNQTKSVKQLIPSGTNSELAHIMCHPETLIRNFQKTIPEKQLVLFKDDTKYIDKTLNGNWPFINKKVDINILKNIAFKTRGTPGPDSIFDNFSGWKMRYTTDKPRTPSTVNCVKIDMGQLYQGFWDRMRKTAGHGFDDSELFSRGFIEELKENATTKKGVLWWITVGNELVSCAITFTNNRWYERPGTNKYETSGSVVRQLLQSLGYTKRTNVFLKRIFIDVQWD